jgi:PhzF family phenazine biosynthesis protein
VFNVTCNSVCFGDFFQKMKKILQRTSCHYWLVDAFTRKPFAGNPASVLFLPAGLEQEEKWMLSVAAEINSPVTCFLSSLKPHNYTIRWFTPTKELQLCGHATIAGAHVIYNEQKLVPLSVPLRFHTQFSGVITVKAETKDNEQISDEEEAKRIELSFPFTPIEESSLRQEDCQIIRSCFKIDTEYDLLFVGKTAYDLVLVVKPEAFHAMPPSDGIDFNEVKKVNTSRGIIITTIGNRYPSLSLLADSKSINYVPAFTEERKYDYFLRMFLPRYGINEDYVSGSAFSAIAPYWTNFLREKNYFGESPRDLSLFGYQTSSRGGEVLTTITDTSRVSLTGSCRTVLIGNWNLDFAIKKENA